MALKRNCPKPGCIRVANGSYCAEHNREHDRERGTKTERGYGKEYQAERRRQAKRVEQGGVNCWRCGKAIHPGTPWHLGHDDNDRSIIRGPECPPCNLSAAGKAAHRYQ